MSFDGRQRGELEQHAATASELIENGRYREALEHLYVVVQERPNHPGVLWELAMAYSNLEYNTEALAVLEQLNRRIPSNVELRTAMGCIQLRLGRYEDAKVNLLRAYAADRENALILRNLGHAYQGLGDAASAEQAFLAAHEMDSADNRTVQALAQFYMRKPDLRMAEHWVKLLLSRANDRETDAERWLLRIQTGWA